MHLLFSYCVYGLQRDRNLDIIFNCYFVSKILYSNSCAEEFCTYLILGCDQIALNFFFHIFRYRNIRNFLLFFSGSDMKHCTNTNSSNSGIKYESASLKLPPVLYNFAVYCSSHIKWISGFILAHCTDQITVRSVACNKL
jgi:hypothetical protein